MSANKDEKRGVLVVRLGAMGDLLHALPAAASLKHSFPDRPLTWVVEAAWRPLLEGNPFIDRIVELDRRRPAAWLRTLRDLRGQRYSLAVDFQGLIKSALVAGLSRAESIVGHRDAREPQAAWFYSQAVQTTAEHVVDRNLELAQAAGASNLVRTFPIPAGKPEGQLPDRGFVWQVRLLDGPANNGRSNITRNWLACSRAA
jgi:heptosyltransferase-1